MMSAESSSQYRDVSASGEPDRSDTDLNLAFQRYIDEVYTPIREKAPDLLTKRQSEVLRLIARGKPRYWIAQELGITQESIGTRLYGKDGVFVRLGVSSEEEAMIKAVSRGQLDFAAAIQVEKLDLNRVKPLTPIHSDLLFSLIKNGGEGRSNTVIANELSLSVDAVNFGLPKMFYKIGVNTRVQAVLYATGVMLALPFIQSNQQSGTSTALGNS